MTCSRKRYPRHCLAELIKDNRYRRAAAVVNAHEERVVNDFLTGQGPLICRLPPEDELALQEARLIVKAREIAERMRRDAT